MRLRVKAQPHLRVRSGPGTEYRLVATVRCGVEVEVVESQPHGGPWVYVEPQGPDPDAAYRPGWVHSGHLTAEREAKAGPRCAKSLDRLLAQVNARAPGRNRTHDGWIGDAAHQGRKSDHNPLPSGVVTARDFTHDSAGGLDCQKLADALVASRDPRIKYVIWRGRICSSKQRPWEWRTYKGQNDHSKHLHLSVDADPKLYDDARAWGI